DSGLHKQLQQLMDTSQGSQLGGVLVRGPQGALLLVNATSAGPLLSFVPNLKVESGQQVVGVFHTHPEPGGGVTFSAGDISAMVNGGAVVEIVQSGGDQFLLLRTQQTPKTVNEADVLRDYEIAMRPLLGQGKTVAQATQAAAVELAQKHRLAYY